HCCILCCQNLTCITDNDTRKMKHCKVKQICAFLTFIYFLGVGGQHGEIAVPSDGPIISICGIPGYDVSNLTRADFWVFAQSGVCLGGNATDYCAFYLAFCKPLLLDTNCSGESACQQNSSGAFSIGGYDVTGPFKESNDYEGFYTKFTNGAPTHNSNHEPCNVSSTIQFSCNRDVGWLPIERPGPNPVPSQVPGQIYVYYNHETCNYLMTFEFAGACSLVPLPVRFLSIGSMLILICLASFILYFSLGALYNSLRGKTGRDVPPNAAFWDDLPYLVWDGVKFSYSSIRNIGNHKEQTKYEPIEGD
ncbi:unnamed protein product, partial [Owenia fusiformis]